MLTPADLTTTDHARMQHLVSLYQDRALPRAEMRVVEAHLNRCETCRAACDAYNALEKQLRTYMDIPRSLVPDLKTNIIRYTDGRSRRRANFLKRVRSVGAALSLLVLVGGFAAASFWVATGGLSPQPLAADPDDAVLAVAQYTPTQDSAVVRAAAGRFTVLAETAKAQSDDATIAQSASATAIPPKTTPKTEPPATATPASVAGGTSRSDTLPQPTTKGAAPIVPVAPKTAVPPTPPRSSLPTVTANGGTNGIVVAQSSPLQPLGTPQTFGTITGAAASADTAPLSTVSAPATVVAIAAVPSVAATYCVAPGVSPDGTIAAFAFPSDKGGYLPVITDSAMTTPRAALPPIQPATLNLPPDTKNTTCGRSRALWLGLRLVSFLYYADNGASALIIVDAQNGTATTLAAPAGATSVSLLSVAPGGGDVRATLVWGRVGGTTRQDVTLAVGQSQPNVTLAVPTSSIAP